LFATEYQLSVELSLVLSLFATSRQEGKLQESVKKRKEEKD